MLNYKALVIYIIKGSKGKTNVSNGDLWTIKIILTDNFEVCFTSFHGFLKNSLKFMGKMK